jgi:hypothetical protein
MFKKSLKETLKKAASRMSSVFPMQEEDTYQQGPSGHVFMTLKDEQGQIIEKREKKNVITKDFSILLARLCKDSLDPNHGVFALAVGEGDSGWDLQNPPAPTDTQRSLYNEIDRKDFSDVSFRKDDGSSSSVPTPTVDFTATFAKTEAVGPIVEMGLLGGDVHNDLLTTQPITPPNGPYDKTLDVNGQDMLCNYLTFPVINKPSTATFSVTWRITF